MYDAIGVGVQSACDRIRHRTHVGSHVWYGRNYTRSYNKLLYTVLCGN